MSQRDKNQIKDGKTKRARQKKNPASLPRHHRDVFHGDAAKVLFTYKKDAAKYPFLLSYYKYRTITPACIENGVSYVQYKNWFREDAEFREACSSIQDKVVHELEDAGFRRALKGSDSLLQFFLRAFRPDQYTERRELTGKGGTPLKLAEIDMSKLDEKTLQQIAAIAEKLEASK